MNNPKKNITRREFLSKSTQASIAIALGLPVSQLIADQNSKKSRVILVRHQDAINEKDKINTLVVESMLDDAVCALADHNNVKRAWEKFIAPQDVVGVKSNEWSPLETPPQLENAIVERLRAIGVNKRDISVDDRGVRRNKVFRRSTALINIRPFRTHHWSGVGSCIKNYIIFSDDPPQYHPDSCADLGAVWYLPLVKGKTRLNILVMLTPLFHGVGPHHWNKKFTWPYMGIIVGTDPVAVDTVGLKILEAHRRNYFGKSKPVWPPPKHIALADTRHHLGTSNWDDIEIVKLGWQDDSLID